MVSPGTLPLFFKPFEPCITMWILELVPAPRMFPVTIWTLYTIPRGYSYMSGYQTLCQWVTMVHGTRTPKRAEQEPDQPDLNKDSPTQEFTITQDLASWTENTFFFLDWIKTDKTANEPSLGNRNVIVLQSKRIIISMQTIWRKQPSIELIFILGIIAFSDMRFPLEKFKDEKYVRQYFKAHKQNSSSPVGWLPPTRTSLWIFPSSSSTANQRLIGNSYTTLFPISSTITCIKSKNKNVTIATLWWRSAVYTFMESYSKSEQCSLRWSCRGSQYDCSHWRLIKNSYYTYWAQNSFITFHYLFMCHYSRSHYWPNMIFRLTDKVTVEE